MASIPDEELVPPVLEPGVYKHYKGNKYEVIGVGLDSETLKPLVIYKPLYKSNVPYWVRSYDMFTDHVVIDDIEQPRFTRVVQ